MGFRAHVHFSVIIMLAFQKDMLVVDHGKLLLWVRCFFLLKASFASLQKK